MRNLNVGDSVVEIAKPSESFIITDELLNNRLRFKVYGDDNQPINVGDTARWVFKLQGEDLQGNMISDFMLVNWNTYQVSDLDKNKFVKIKK